METRRWLDVESETPSFDTRCWGQPSRCRTNLALFKMKIFREYKKLIDNSIQYQQENRGKRDNKVGTRVCNYIILSKLQWHNVQNEQP